MLGGIFLLWKSVKDGDDRVGGYEVKYATYSSWEYFNSTVPKKHLFETYWAGVTDNSIFPLLRIDKVAYFRDRDGYKPISTLTKFERSVYRLDD